MTPRAHGCAGRTTARTIAGLAGLAAVVVCVSGAALLQPDESWRDAQLEVRAAQRDTLGHGTEPARLDTLALALLRVGRFDDASRIFHTALVYQPGDAGACAGLGKLALFAGRLAEAESLLAIAVATDRDREWVADLYAAHVQHGAWGAAAPLAEELGDPGRAEMLRMMDATPPRLTAGPDESRIPWVRPYPIPLVRVKVNGELILMAIDTGARDVLLDPSAARRAKAQTFPTKSLVSWLGNRTSGANAMIQRLELGGMKLEDVPATLISLRKWSIEVNPKGESVGGVIGLSVLRSFTPTIDYVGHALVLRRPGVSYTPAASAQRIPFEIWGESDLTVWGNLAGGRRMALTVHSGVPGCGAAAPPEVWQEVGIKAKLMSRITKGAGSWLGGKSWTRVTLPSASAGPITSGKLDGWSGAMDSADLWRHGVRRDALLSNDFFNDYRVTYDWAARSLVFETKK